MGANGILAYFLAKWPGTVGTHLIDINPSPAQGSLRGLSPGRNKSSHLYATVANFQACMLANNTTTLPSRVLGEKLVVYRLKTETE